MKTVLAIAFTAFAVNSTAAATLTNKDPDSQTIVVTEDGVKSEVAIASGESVTICDGGCFLTLPNGDRAALAGSEDVDIVNGGAIIK